MTWDSSVKFEVLVPLWFHRLVLSCFQNHVFLEIHVGLLMSNTSFSNVHLTRACRLTSVVGWIYHAAAISYTLRSR